MIFSDGCAILVEIRGYLVTEPRTYPAGAISWIDLDQADLRVTRTFYGALFGWTFVEGTGSYLVAQLDGLDVAGVGGPAGANGWHTYVAVDDVVVAAGRVESAGGRVVVDAFPAGMGGTAAICTDPSGAAFGLWQAGVRPGAQAVNRPGAWNFSDLHSAAPAASAAFYGQVLGWSIEDAGFGQMIRLPGYGDHLAATSDPEIHERQAGVGAPPGFADALGWMAPVAPGEEPHWHVTFTVADRDATAASVERLDGTVLGTTDTDWTRDVLVRDPQGAIFTASQFTPPGS